MGDLTIDYNRFNILGQAAHWSTEKNESVTMFWLKLTEGQEMDRQAIWVLKMD